VIEAAEVQALMKRCQRGFDAGKRGYQEGHSILADCYGTLGALLAERDALRAAADTNDVGFIDRMLTEIQSLRVRLNSLLQGEWICAKCGLRKDSDHPKDPAW
jgi:hypothetical protein